jgi:hypothetical protein
MKLEGRNKNRVKGKRVERVERGNVGRKEKRGNAVE